MAGLFYKGVSGVGNSLKAAWNLATGNAMLHNRGLTPYYKGQAEMTMIGFTFGLVIGTPMAAVMTGSAVETLAVLAAATFGPALATQMPIALYRAGKYDVHQLQLADQRAKPKQLADQRKSSEPPLI